MDSKQPFGPHLMIDAADCDPEKLADQRLIYTLLDSLPDKMGMTKIMQPVVREWQDKWAAVPGYSGFVMIAESHISIHTFPQERYVFIDIFSCKEFDVEKSKQYLSTAFGARQVSISVTKRGLNFPRNLNLPQTQVKA